MRPAIQVPPPAPRRRARGQGARAPTSAAARGEREHCRDQRSRSAEERREVLHARIERVAIDPESGTLRVTFHEPAPPSDPQPTTEAAP
jgi:hypothetical protein